MSREELTVHRADMERTEPDDLVFSTSNGTPHSQTNIRRRIVGKAVERANVKLAKAGLAPIAGPITNHSLRRTFASLLYEAGASLSYVMAQMGHTRRRWRSRSTRARWRVAATRGRAWTSYYAALIGHKWAQTRRTVRARSQRRKRKSPLSRDFPMGGDGVEPPTSCL
jgi:Phage integrase family